MKFFLRLFAAALLAASAHAQQFDNPVTVPVSFYGEAETNGASESYFSFGSGIGGPALATQNGNPGGVRFYSGLQTGSLIPGKEYEVVVTSNGCAAVWANFYPRAGQEIYLMGGKANSITMGPNYTFRVRVELVNGAGDVSSSLAGRRGGEGSSFPEDKPMWFIGLGSMRGGKFAGAVGFRSDTITSNLFNTSSLIYETTDSDEVSMTRSGAGHITEVRSREVVLKMDAYNASGTSYDIRAYVPGSETTPFATYTVMQHPVSGGEGIRINRTEDGVIWSTALQKVGSTWTRYEWQRVGSPTGALSVANGTTTVVSGSTSTVTYGSGGAARVKVKNFAGGELASETWGTGLSPAQTTSYSYYPDAGGTGWPSAVESITEPSGNWTKYDYYNVENQDGAPGQISRIYRPWKDTPSTAASASAGSGRVETLKYVTNYDNTKTALSERIVTIGGTTAGKTTWDYNFNFSSPNGFPLIRTIRNDYASSSSYLTTTTLAHRPDIVASYYHDKPHSVTYPDGRKDSYAYFNGAWNAGTKAFTASNTAPNNADRLILVFHGQTTAGTPVSSWTNNGITWNLDPLHMVSARSTVSMTVIDAKGRVVFSGGNVYSAGSLVLVSGTGYTFDGHGRIAVEQDASRTAGTTTHSYSPVTSGFASTHMVTAADGVVTRHDYDDFQRLATTTTGVGGNSDYPEKVQQTVYNNANLPEKTYTCDCGTSPVVFVYDTAGRITDRYEKSPNDPNNASAGSLNTHYEYVDGTTRETTLPTGATRLEEHYLDGRVKSITGTAQPPIFYDYAVNSTGVLTTMYRAATASRTNGWSEEQGDWLGRTTKRSTPATGYDASHTSNVIDVVSTYAGATGLLSKQATTYRVTGGAQAPDRLFTYDAAGQVIADGLDVNADGSLTGASNDRVSLFDRYFTNSSGWRAEETIGTYATSGSATVTTLAKTSTRLTGFGSGVIGEVAGTDANGRVTTRTQSVTPLEKRVTTQTAIAGIGNAGYQKTVNGYDYETQLPSGERIAKDYDLRGRLENVYSRWSGTAYGTMDTYEYHHNTSYVKRLTVAGVVSDYAYAWNGDGRTVTTTIGVNATYTRYNEMDLPLHVGGAGASATAFGYDAQGRRTSLTTYRGGPYTESNWPSSGGDQTTWTPDPATGLVTRKTFADANHVDFTYTPLGQPKTRTWARGVVTTYEYYDGTGTTTSDVSHRTQELKGVVYSSDPANTPTLSYTYKRTGLPAGVSDVTGSRIYGYASDYPLRSVSETLGSFYHNSGTARVLTPNYASYGRNAGFTLGTAAAPAADLSQTGDYVGASGLVNHLYTGAKGGAARTFTYGYKTSSALVDNYATGNFTASYDYDATSAARRTKVEGAWSGASRTRFDLAYDSRGLLLSAKQSGSALADHYAGTSYSSVYNYHLYDERQQVKTTAMYRGTPPSSGLPSGGDQLPGRRFEYRYDGAGNRTTAGATGSAGTGDDEYTPNALNQYASKENNTVRVLGTAATAATVTIPGVTVTKQDRNFAANVIPSNGSTPASGNVAVTATVGATVNTQTRPWQIARQTQSFTYDADGNLTGDGLWTYQYDGENRLIRMEATSAATGAGLPNQVLEFKYDHMGRRVQKRTNNVTAGTDVYTRYVYDGWNVVAEFEATSSTCGTLRRSFTWGLDLAGGASTGGVGALVQITDHVASKTYFPTYDGNGNVSSLIDTDGAVGAVYEYSPFGEVLRAEGGYAAENPFRFSTKWTDNETGLSYYGYRYYSANLGRFINRDPIEEAGGLNLYAFVGNNPGNRVDALGLSDIITLPSMMVTGDDCVFFPDSGELICKRWSQDDLFSYTFDNWGKFPNVPTSRGVTGSMNRPAPPAGTKAPNSGPRSTATLDQVQAAAIAARNANPDRDYIPAPDWVVGSPYYYAFRWYVAPQSYKDGTGAEYLLDFGYKNIGKFNALATGDVSQQLKGFVRQTGIELQRGLEDALANNPSLVLNRADLLNAAYQSHTGAYERGGFGNLTFQDQMRVAFTPDLGDSFGNTKAYPVFADTLHLVNPTKWHY